MIFVLKLTGYFLLWTLYSYTIHYLAHTKIRYNFLKYFHLKHHAYDYGESFFPPWHDYFFWFGHIKSSMDVYITFTLPLVLLAMFDPLYGVILLVFHYFYEVFLSRNVLDHNPRIKGWITKIIPIGSFHLMHHRHAKCNYSFFITLWDHVFRTNDVEVLGQRNTKEEARKKVANERHQEIELALNVKKYRKEQNERKGKKSEKEPA